jgi:[ribosomal protein S18]-alanine N-acetyltransferase
MAAAVDSIVLEPLRWWHLPDILVLEEELFAPECWSEELFWSELAQIENRCYLIALDGAEIVGYAGLATGSEEAFIQTLGVTASHQRRGVGARLLVALLDEARRRGAERVGLEVRADGPVAQRLYARHGFEAVGRRRGYYQPSNVDAIVMLLEFT